ncbi:MAG: carbamoyl-phosphate synthase large subunit [Methanocellales archaeon]|nr:carbamoyl-phosphate synthase large subunit [Methanocellales archaeon]MDD3292043.1 carbamoyl-phosphate synthase large subunit [Methanocellales archaeon]MDD5485600.1 carbamoyl-phosphate synthase large subunit [Methanocellales archaeon]
MPKSESIKKVLLIGSGPIQIGQAAEFDFSGSQACRALREEGVRVVLVNSNPATIMTDFEMADVIYIEPLITDVVAKIIEKELPDGILAGFGGQTGLNITAELAEAGILSKYNVQVLGTPLEAIYNAEDRERFKQTMERIEEPVPRGFTVTSIEEAEAVATELGLPLIVRPSYTLGGTGGGIARTTEELREIVSYGLHVSRIRQVLLEESVLGWKEIEYEVMRDAKDTCITICNMENVDPTGIHTGESIVVTPSQTLTDEEHQMLRSAAIKIIRELKLEGGCNIQFALKEGSYRVIEVNPRVSRSSALASKATGYPIARVAAKIAIGLQLDEIRNDVTKETPASFEPAIDYVVIKIPRWPFDKFPSADRTLTTSMKSTGEVMAIGRTFEEALQKALRSLDIDKSFDNWSDDELKSLLKTPTDERIFAIYEALKRGFSLTEIADLSCIDPFFIRKIDKIVRFETKLQKDLEGNLREAKRLGFSDERIAQLTGKSREEIADLRKEKDIFPTYKIVDTCAAEFEAKTPYFYSTYEDECELKSSARKKVLIIGAGPIRIGQGIEFDYCTVHAVKALKEEGVEAHIINNNPETVSTDYDTSDKLFFEPLTLEDVMNVIEKEHYEGVMVQFGGQTSVNLAVPLKKELERTGSKTVILGTDPERIDAAEDRERFSKLLLQLNIPQAESGYATSLEKAKEVASRIGFPVLVRPSYVLGGRAMQIVYDIHDLIRYTQEAVRVSKEKPVLIDKFLEKAIEVDIDAVSDGEDTLVGAIMEHIEEAGVHSGDSSCVIPPQSLPKEVIERIKDYVRRVALSLKIKGLLNIQMAIKGDVIYILEANPRSSRTIPYVAKAKGIPLAKIAAKVMLGHRLRDLSFMEREVKHVAVKEVVLPFSKLKGVDTILGPEMKSTGEVMGINGRFDKAFYKAELAADNPLPIDSNSTVFISVCDEDKEKIVEVARTLQKVGISIVGTEGTVDYLRQRGIEARKLKKIQEGSPNVLEMMHAQAVNLVINTLTGKQSSKDSYQIRRGCIDLGVPYLTTVQAAKAAASAIAKMNESQGEIEVKSINEYFAG